MVYREAEDLSWCPSWSNSLWQGWSWGLVYCPAGNATDPIWRVLDTSDGISSWTLLKPQHGNPNPNPLANQLWYIVFLTPPTPHTIPHRLPAFLESLKPLKERYSIHPRRSKIGLKHSIRFCGIFPKFKTQFYCISFFLTSRLHFWNSAAVTIGCIPIALVAVHLKLKSQKLVCHLIRCIAITYWIVKSLRQF